jgi:hypothetical protein
VADAPLATLIRRAIMKSSQNFVTCFSEPAACDPSKFTTAQGTYRQALTAGVKKYLEVGQRARANAADPTYFVVRAAGLDPTGDLATAKVCMWDTLIVYRPSETPGGTETIVNDDKASIEMSYIMVLENGVWLVANAQSSSKSTQENTCPARP